MEDVMSSFINSYLNIEEDSKDVWRIQDDLTADNCLDKIRELKAEYNRFEMVAKAKIEQIENTLEQEKERMEREVGYFEGKLLEYFQTIDPRETKTQQIYNLPSGTLRLKKSKPKYEYNKEKLLEAAEHKGMKDYIKIKKDFDWVNFKKNLKIVGDTIINKGTGEIVDLEGLTVAEKPAEFQVEV